MLKSQIIEAVREEVRAVLSEPPTPASVMRDIGYLFGALPPEDARTFAAMAIKPLADFIDATTPAEEPESETTGADATGEMEA